MSFGSTFAFTPCANLTIKADLGDYATGEGGSNLV